MTSNHVLIGLAAGAATGLLAAAGTEMLVPHRNHSYDDLLFISFTVIGAAAGATTGYAVALYRQLRDE